MTNYRFLAATSDSSVSPTNDVEVALDGQKEKSSTGIVRCASIVVVHQLRH
jgi:hypothetical protein